MYGMDLTGATTSYIIAGRTLGIVYLTMEIIRGASRPFETRYVGYTNDTSPPCIAAVPILGWCSQGTYNPVRGSTLLCS